MPKLKTNKALAKRIKVTGRKKLLKRHVGQNHFNAKNSGKQGRVKHHVTMLSSDFPLQKIMRRLP